MLTGDEYRKSLDDGRAVYYDGDRVNVVEHPIFERAIASVAEIYDHYYKPEPGAISDFLETPSTVEEMQARAELKTDRLTTINYGSLMTLLTAADRIESIRPQSSQAMRAYVREMQVADLRLVQCISDAKGDRSKAPGKQEDPDAYLRVVDRRADGVVVNGAKLHISGAPIAHELLTIPTKAMKPGEEDYAVAFSIPMNTPGVIIVNVTSETPDMNFADMPLTEFKHPQIGFVIFDNVFVPNERLFLDGEVEASAAFAHSLGLWVRMDGLKSMADEADLMCGFAQLLANANGLERISHIKDKIADLVIHATLIRATLEASIANSTITEEGVVVPDEQYANAGKYQAAQFRTAMMQHLQDIAGGSLITAPSSRDLENAEVGHFVRKYMSTKQSVDGAYRTKLFHAVNDLTSGRYAGHDAVGNLHGGGGLFAQRTVTRIRYDMASSMQKALEAAGLTGLTGSEG